MHTIRLTDSLDVDDLSRELSDADAFELVTMLDEVRGDWSFTLRLADHFDKLRAEHAKEKAEDAAKREAAR
jgi:hypothetical protein